MVATSSSCSVANQRRNCCDVVVLLDRQVRELVDLVGDLQLPFQGQFGGHIGRIQLIGRRRDAGMARLPPVSTI
jgi:hypothetical protein